MQRMRLLKEIRIVNRRNYGQIMKLEAKSLTIVLQRKGRSILCGEKIRDDIQMGKRKYTDFAVLYRTNAQSRMVEEIFLKSNIPYKIVGGTSSTTVKRLKTFWRIYA